MITYIRQNKVQKFINEFITPRYTKQAFNDKGLQVYTPNFSKVRLSIFTVLLGISLFIPMTTSPLLYKSGWFFK